MKTRYAVAASLPELGQGRQARAQLLKGYIQKDVYEKYRERYKQCIRMLNGLEKSLERHLPEQERRWAAPLR